MPEREIPGKGITFLNYSKNILGLDGMKCWRTLGETKKVLDKQKSTNYLK
jgi:hypothetical protein